MFSGPRRRCVSARLTAVGARLQGVGNEPPAARCAHLGAPVLVTGNGERWEVEDPLCDS
jgi:hypothetical protein